MSHARGLRTVRYRSGGRGAVEALEHAMAGLRPLSVGRGRHGHGRDIGPHLSTRHCNVVTSPGDFGVPLFMERMESNDELKIPARESICLI